MIAPDRLESRGYIVWKSESLFSWDIALDACYHQKPSRFRGRRNPLKDYDLFKKLNGSFWMRAHGGGNGSTCRGFEECFVRYRRPGAGCGQMQFKNGDVEIESKIMRVL